MPTIGAYGARPTALSGPIVGTNGETWRGVDNALKRAARGLPSGWSLASLLEDRRGYRNVRALPKLTIASIVRLARKHQSKCGAWPTTRSGQSPVVRTHGRSSMMHCGGDIAGCPGEIRCFGWGSVSHRFWLQSVEPSQTPQEKCLSADIFGSYECFEMVRLTELSVCIPCAVQK